MVRQFFLAVIVLALIAAPALATTEENYKRCRDGETPCDASLLTLEEARIVAVLTSGRNVAACAARAATCDATKLTPAQVATLAKIEQEEAEARRAAILEKGRNLSACAYRQVGCDVTRLTPEEIEGTDRCTCLTSPLKRRRKTSGALALIRPRLSWQRRPALRQRSSRGRRHRQPRSPPRSQRLSPRRGARRGRRSARGWPPSLP